jgi:hypothetical protein
MGDSATYRGDGTMATKHIGATKTGADVANAEATSRLSSTAGAGLGKKGSGFVPPKMLPNEDSSAYSERVRKARAAHDSEPPKAQALRGLMKK